MAKTTTIKTTKFKGGARAMDTQIKRPFKKTYTPTVCTSCGSKGKGTNLVKKLDKWEMDRQ